MGRSFVARFTYGRCSICDLLLEEGQEVAYLDDELCHAGCVEDEGEEVERG